jgi:hypothetical protein
VGWDAFHLAEVLLTQPLMVVVGDKVGAFGAYRDGCEIIGRARREIDAEEIVRRRRQGETWRAIAQAMHCPARTPWRAHAAATNGAGGGTP